MPRRNVSRPKHVAVALAGVAGFVDAVGYLTLAHLFTAHMTGNTSKLGVAVAHGNLRAAAPLALAPPLFALGVALGTLLVDAERPTAPLLLQATLVLCFMVVGDLTGSGDGTAHSPYPFYVLEACATVALGLQTSALTDVDGTTIRTSYVSGVLTNLVQGGVRRLRGGPDRKPLVLLAAILAAYLTGAVAGALGLRAVSLWCLALPTAILLAASLRRR